MANSPATLRCHEVRTRFGDKDVLRGVSLMLEAGRTVALQGRSGAGKSSLLLALAGLRTISSGEIEFNGVRYDHLSDSKRARIRLKSFGVVFQQGRLVPELSVGENVELGLRLLGSGRRDVIRRSREKLDVLGVGDLYNCALSEISGGQEQRVAIARALVHRPSIVLADEPTGSLDAATANSAVVAMLDVVRTSQAAALVVTHDANVAAACDVQMTLVDGRTELASAVAGSP